MMRHRLLSSDLSKAYGEAAKRCGWPDELINLHVASLAQLRRHFRVAGASYDSGYMVDHRLSQYGHRMVSRQYLRTRSFEGQPLQVVPTSHLGVVSTATERVTSQKLQEHLEAKNDKFERCGPLRGRQQERARCSDELSHRQGFSELLWHPLHLLSWPLCEVVS